MKHKMTRKRLPKARPKPGPKTIFTNEQLKNVTLLTNLAATNQQIAIFFGVHVDTIRMWEKHVDFNNARLEGGLHADMRVAASLYKRAIGFEYEEIESIRTKSGDFITKVSKKQVHPEVKAIIHWLRIRQREQWNVIDEMNHNHNGKINHIHSALEDIPVNELSKDAQNLLFEIAQKQISNGDRDN